MNVFYQLLGALTQDHAFGGGGNSIDLINAPKKSTILITPNRPTVFKQFNHRFKD